MTRRPLAAIAAAVLVLAGCATTPSTNPTAASTTPQRGGTITYGRAAAVTSFDLNNEITANNAFAIDKVFEPLVSFDTAGKIIPWLAEKYTVSPDLLSYTFHLASGTAVLRRHPCQGRGRQVLPGTPPSGAGSRCRSRRPSRASRPMTTTPSRSP